MSWQLAALSAAHGPYMCSQVDSWYTPPLTAYPGADEFVAVYGPGAPLPNPLLVFGLDVGDNTLVVSAESDRRRRRRH